MKKYLLSALALVALFASCTKESAPANVEENANIVEIRANIINEDAINVDTKTDYTISGNTAYFHWTGTETIGRLWYNNGFGHDAFTSTTQANNGETSLVFSGTSASDQTDYAMYPIWNATDKTGIGWSSAIFKLYLHESMAYNATSPLKNVVPMIAKLDDSEVFNFVPVSGIIAVTVKNLPSTATKITLSSTGKALSGNYRLTPTPSDYATNIDWVMDNGLTIQLASNDGNTTGTKSFTFSGLDKSSHVFYFPVSVGTFDDMTITIYAGDESLQTVKTTKSIEVGKGQIVKFPEMDLAKATVLKLTGDSETPFLFVDKFGPGVTSVKYAVAATEEEALIAAATGNEITAAGLANKVSVAQGATGKYYIGYIVYSSSEAVLSNVIPLHYITSTDAALAGTYKMAYHASIYPTTLSDNGDDTLTLSVSDDPTKGNFMITQAFGFCNEVSKSTHRSLREYDFSQFRDGSPIYGFYNPSISNPKLVFSDISKQVFYYDASNHPHFICEYGTDTLRFGFNSNAYNSTTYDIICWGGYIMNCYDNTSSYDMFVQQFAANKLP